jgi:hypothetical protein
MSGFHSYYLLFLAKNRESYPQTPAKLEGIWKMATNYKIRKGFMRFSKYFLVSLQLEIKKT